MSVQIFISEVRYALDNTDKPEFSIRLSRKQWLEALVLIENIEPECGPMGAREFRRLRQQVKDLSAELLEARSLAEAQVALRESSQEAARAARSRLEEVRREMRELKRRHRLSKPSDEEALMAGLRLDLGEDPAQVAAEGGWSSGAALASHVVAARLAAQMSADAKAAT